MLNSRIECFINSNPSFRSMKRSAMLIGIGIIILGISMLGGLYLMDSESIEKTKTPLSLIEPESPQQEESVSNNVKCAPTAFGGMRCSP